MEMFDEMVDCIDKLRWEMRDFLKIWRDEKDYDHKVPKKY